MKKIAGVLLAVILLLQYVPFAALAAEESVLPFPQEDTMVNTAPSMRGAGEESVFEGSDETETEAEAQPRLAASGTFSGRSSVAKPTMEELRQRLAAIPEISELVPGYQPYFTGSEEYYPLVLSDEAYANGLAWINYFRTAAGLGEVTLTDELNLSAAWGAMWLIMGEPGLGIMSEEDDLKGFNAAVQSNISVSAGDWGIYSLGDAVVGQMEDGDEEMMPTVGHRRWLLDPRTRTMGIGSFSEEEYYITDIRVFGDDVSTQDVTDYDFISWPASGNNISELFFRTDPWSITLNPARYAAPDRSKVQVTLTRKRDDMVWVFNKDTDISVIYQGADYFNVDNDEYGVPNCIIFRPYETDLLPMDGEFVVDVTGITDTAGNPASLHYTVLFDSFEKPAFKSQSLVLSGEIGVNFFLDLPSIDGVDYWQSYMEFKVGNGKPVKVMFDPDKTNSKGYYGFTCYVSSIEMADTITATFHYGTGKTISKEYSVARYIESFDKNAGKYDEKTVDLIHAIADFGHYEQIYLSDVNGWTIGENYREMTNYYTTEFDYPTILSAVESKAFVKPTGNANVEKATYKLHLDSVTTVDVFLTVKSGVTLTASATFNGKTYSAVKQSDGRYMVQIPNISAHQLGDMITITGNAGGAFTVKVSALSYTRSVLNSTATNTAAKDGLSALYKYYAAVLAYRS